jgi:uncharacterized protein (TIGR02145 family)
MKFIFLIALISLSLSTLISCSGSSNDVKPAQKKMDKIVADTINAAFLRDSSLFLTVEIGSQIWMKNDLQLTEFLNGDPISEARSNEEWVQFAKMKKPCFRKSGQSILYNGYVLIDERGLIPEDFRIPTSLDWDILINELGGIIPMSKSISSYNWSEKTQVQSMNYEGNNSSGFSAIPTGYIYTSGNIAKGTCSFWWVNSSPQSLVPTKLSIFNIGFCDSEISRGMQLDPAFGACLRCLKKK